MKEAEEYKIDVIEASDICADDEAVTNIFKEHGFERIMISYKMRKTL